MSLDRVVVSGVPAWLPEGLQKRAEDIRIAFRFSPPERRIYRRRRRIPVSVWAARHRMVTRGPFEGSLFRPETTPYLPGILDASFFPSVEVIGLCTAPQVGKSFAIDTCIAYAIDRAPGSVLYIYPGEDTAIENSRDRIHPMIAKSPRLRSYLTGVSADEAAKRINLQHMQIYLGWARSAEKLANRTVRYLVFDETDKYPETAGKREADPISLGEARRIWYAKLGSRQWIASTPTVETGPIWVYLTREAQAVFEYWPACPACGRRQRMEFESDERWFRWPEEERDPERIEAKGLAWYVCRHCGARWDDAMRDRAVRGGEWRSSARRDFAAEAAGIPLKTYLHRYRPAKIGFHLPSWMSQFVSLSKIAADFLRAQGSRNKLKDFNNKHRAEPWKDYTVERKEDRILALKDDRPMGIVPSGGLTAALVAGIDTQDNGFYYIVRAFGWGMLQESWLVRFGFVTSFEALARILWEEQYLDTEGTDYRLQVALQDAMGHRTKEVYDFVRARQGKIFASQGVDTRRMAAPMSWSNIEFYPGARARAIPGGIKLLRFDATYYKNELASKLEVNPEDPGAFRLNREATEEYARHLCAEYLDEDKQIWINPDKANHYWDCEVMGLVAADLARVRFWRPGAERKERPTPRKPAAPGFVPRREGWLKR